MLDAPASHPPPRLCCARRQGGVGQAGQLPLVARQAARPSPRSLLSPGRRPPPPHQHPHQASTRRRRRLLPVCSHSKQGGGMPAGRGPCAREGLRCWHAACLQSREALLLLPAGPDAAPVPMRHPLPAGFSAPTSSSGSAASGSSPTGKRCAGCERFASAARFPHSTAAESSLLDRLALALKRCVFCLTSSHFPGELLEPSTRSVGAPQGLEQFSRECDQADFRSAIAEVERYRAGGERGTAAGPFPVLVVHPRATSSSARLPAACIPSSPARLPPAPPQAACQTSST